ncbi:MAG: hypothetical protein DRN17_05025 [Thermoplasmata archaeon]|nr:MAG: hypothetical protein DRN17_05025 [Thermoplasmata archaeon]
MAIGKKLAISLLRKNGDSLIELIGEHDGFLCTTDFSNKYIRRVRRTHRFDSLKGKILLFNWTDYEFNAINTRDIFKITPLSTILKNEAQVDG